MSTSSGSFVTLDGRRYYEIRGYDELPPFFMTMVSASDLWLFISSHGGLTAGRGAPEQALFPYNTSDVLHRSGLHTGSRTWLRVGAGDAAREWEPFNLEQRGRYRLERSLLKDELGMRIVFSETNHDLGLCFSYTWTSAGRFGIVREASLRSLGQAVDLELVDGVLNLLPADTPRALQSRASNLIDAYKWNELEANGLATYSLYARISDRAEPAESLLATVAYAVGLEGAAIHLAASDFDALRRGDSTDAATLRRGVAGAFLLHSRLNLAAGATRQWRIVLDTPLKQSDVLARCNDLRDTAALARELDAAQAADEAALRELLASADAFQAVADEHTACHHIANTLFNVMRGGVFDDQYRIDRDDYRANLALRNRKLVERHAAWIESLPASLTLTQLHIALAQQGDAQLRRLSMEYLPLVFGRRHGDPSRPWNHFSIRGRDADGRLLRAYQGNWRDIFQNWEALLLAFPGFAPSIVAKFVNASTVDGYNPYRITHEGIDWEVEDPEDPWSNIGYWGDHQLIYLLRLLELCERHDPVALRQLLGDALFSYANVPYRIADFDALLADPKHTVRFSKADEKLVAERCETLGSDGRLVLDANGEVYLVTLAEKLLVPLLAKLGNLVPGGGVWLNTQRPEWNDANNALVGAGLSMVTLYHARRYVDFLTRLFEARPGDFALGAGVEQWLRDTCDALVAFGPGSARDDAARTRLFQALGRAAERYRTQVYAQPCPAARRVVRSKYLLQCLQAAQTVLDESIAHNRRADGLYHAYNLLVPHEDTVGVDHLYPMLEGQVAVLASGVLGANETADLLDALFASPMYRADQQSFMLYPDARLPGFLEKNRVPAARIAENALLGAMLARRDTRIVEQDPNGTVRFAPAFSNAGDLAPALERAGKDYAEYTPATHAQTLALYEEVFQHRRFTGRSGTMFGFEGLGCIYWHMVSKLLLGVQESFFAAIEQGEDEAAIRRLGEHYYRVRKGLGFNKTPAEYGAFPCDPYSHTPGHSGAQQPGMTGQVKEEVIARFGELGVLVRAGCIRILPALLNAAEFGVAARTFSYRDVNDRAQTLPLAAGELGFTLCQVPFVFRLDQTADASLEVAVTHVDGRSEAMAGPALTRELSRQVFMRSGEVQRVVCRIPAAALFGGKVA
ncbi:hypothetical protein [Niveibacterium microcysteis]|uniref:Cellobiose phosphorylase n=1 Tax=Niveibacterium microcysteis TaxID=2811415 RepID=A0ABX7M4B5_9RHOO|nr:hypothetical protein [Niveibacterium microcysteis]QSI76587.1 hypothetical protein JY500_19335 [Niveibacterium microcysteis]